MTKKNTIGFTTTIPVEIIFAGGFIPCDLNNVFITGENPIYYIERAEKDGFPKSMCNWIKGIYGVIMEEGIETVITVMEGDCSNTQALAEILTYKGIKVIPFSYPYDRDGKALKREIEKLKHELSVEKKELVRIEKGIRQIRLNLEEIDKMTWQEKVVTGYENHLWLVRASDMLGDYNQYNDMARAFIENAKTRKKNDAMSIGYIGVPPIFLDLHDFVEENGVHIVLNETQRQFSLPYFSKDADIVERYRLYTYPYGIFFRIEDIKKEIKRRKIKGIIHYVQAFCYRVMEDVILRDALGVPFITIEGDLPAKLDSRTKLRIEAFIEMLKERT
ncbi:MAG: 2-hydroxyacyl-CoA dehydratase [Proteobacteria bacterium]|nr:2-hydroxyacyl-CoA dehydratase [Pseudomonadota bacterium]